MSHTLCITAVLILSLGILFIVLSKRKGSKKVIKALEDKDIQQAKEIEELKREGDRLRHVNMRLTEDTLALQKQYAYIISCQEARDEYILELLCKSKSYLTQMDDHRKIMLKFAMTNPIADIVNRLKSNELITAEEEKFYHDFDSAFLKLHPDFVKNFNELFDEKDRIEHKNSEQLSTELRIFALIRLGMSDPSHIANFLNCSMPTIYNYRSRVKNKSLYSKGEFDERLMQC